MAKAKKSTKKEAAEAEEVKPVTNAAETTPEAAAEPKAKKSSDKKATAKKGFELSDFPAPDHNGGNELY